MKPASNTSINFGLRGSRDVGTSGLGTRPPDEGPLDTPASREKHLTTLKASIIKEFDTQASMLAKSCKLLVSDNSDQSRVIVTLLGNTLMKLAEKLALKYEQHSGIQLPSQ